MAGFLDMNESRMAFCKSEASTVTAMASSAENALLFFWIEGYL